MPAEDRQSPATPPDARKSSESAGARRRLFLALAVLIVGAGLTESFTRSQEHRFDQQYRQEVLLRAAAIRASLEGALNETVYLANGLVAFIRSVDPIEEENAELALRAVFESDPHIRNVGLAPDNILRYIYPIQGNEAALGLSYANVPTQWPSVQRAMQTRKTVVTGPVALVQGGRALISRTPVFLSDGRYWGLISIVIDIDELIHDAGLDATVDGVDYWLQGDTHSASPTAPAADTIVGNPNTMARSPLTMSIDIPGGTWRLIAAPVDSWARPHPYLQALRSGGMALSALLAWFVWSLLHGRALSVAHARRLSETNAQLASAITDLERLTRNDALTGIANRRHFEEALEIAWAQCQRQRQPLSLMLIDVDHFKHINDSLGHAVGDDCLTEIARRLSSGIRRAGELLARYGGEEFVALCPLTGHAEACALAEHLRTLIDSQTFSPHGSDAPLQLSVSIGVSTVVPDASIHPRELKVRADRALYQAKANGRNRVWSLDPKAG